MRKNLVLGTAVGYGLAEVFIFIKSFRKYNRHDDLVLVVDSALDVETAQFYVDNNVRFIIFEAYKYIPTHIQNSRYIKYLEFLLENWPNYRHVFLTDVRDAVFQGDVFENLPEQFLYFFSEDKSDTIRGNLFNAGWIGRNYGVEVLDKIGNSLIYCSGTTLSDYESIRHYLAYMLAQMDLDKILALGDTPGDQGSDQGYHNFLFYCTDLNAVGKANGDIIATLGTTFITSPQSISFDGERYPLDALYPKVLHQYDRNGDMDSYFRNKYN
jgi:hypothetical protein